MGALAVVERRRTAYKTSLAFCANGCTDAANSRKESMGNRTGTHLITIMDRNTGPDGKPAFLCRKCAKEATEIWEEALGPIGRALAEASAAA